MQCRESVRRHDVLGCVGEAACGGQRRCMALREVAQTSCQAVRVRILCGHHEREHLDPLLTPQPLPHPHHLAHRQDLNIDHHRRCSFLNLFSNLDHGVGSRPFQSSGESSQGPHSGPFSTYYNNRQAAGAPATAAHASVRCALHTLPPGHVRKAVVQLDSDCAAQGRCWHARTHARAHACAGGAASRLTCGGK